LILNRINGRRPPADGLRRGVTTLVPVTSNVDRVYQLWL